MRVEPGAGPPAAGVAERSGEPVGAVPVGAVPVGAVPGRRWCDRVTAVLGALAATDLAPSPRVNRGFAELVALAWQSSGTDPRRQPDLLRRARETCARGEGLLEAHWARLIVAGDAAIADFPYLDHYELLVSWEAGVARDLLGRVPASVVVTGCGPLPLTGLLLHRLLPEAVVSCVDVDPTAVALARSVLAAAGVPEGAVDVRVGSAQHHDYRGADLAVVAALVVDEAAPQSPGTKHGALARAGATLAADGLLLARSVPADGRLLLYPPVTAEDIPENFAVAAVREPPRPVVNSVVALKPRRA